MAVQIGVKVWSHNSTYFPHIKKLHRRGDCDFVEVYARINASDQEIKPWQDLGVPIRLHAPHSDGGFNPADSGGIELKLKALDRLEVFRRFLKPLSIIFHPGMDGPLTESIKQYGTFKKAFPGIFEIAYMENKPQINHEGRICRGADPQEVRELIQAFGFGFCLDFGHAAGYAVSVKKNWRPVVESFMELQPTLFHISDGDIASPVDSHRHLGTGSYPLAEMLSFLPSGAWVTLETPHDSAENLDDFAKDADTLRNLINGN